MPEKIRCKGERCNKKINFICFIRPICRLRSGLFIFGTTYVRRRGAHTQPIKPVVEKCMHQGKVLGGICDASGFLGIIGALNHVKHTSNDVNDLKNWVGVAYSGEANYIREQAVSDGNIITANGTAVLELAKEVMLTLKVASEDNIIEWYNFHKFGYYHAHLPKLLK